jgi:hypothetical protein
VLRDPHHVSALDSVIGADSGIGLGFDASAGAARRGERGPATCTHRNPRSNPSDVPSTAALRPCAIARNAEPGAGAVA